MDHREVRQSIGSWLLRNYRAQATTALIALAAGGQVLPATSGDAARRIGRVSGQEPIWAAVGFDPAESAGFFVGIRHFEDPEFVDVPYAVDDAVDLAYLFSVELNLLDPRRAVLCLSGEPAKSDSIARLASLRRAGAETCRPDLMEIYRQVDRLAEASGERGLFILAMASHGFSAAGADLVLAADSRYRLLTSTGLSLAAILDLVSQTRTRRRLVLLDVCRERLSSERAGGVDPDSALGRAFVDTIARAEGQAVLMGTVLGGYSYNDHSRKTGVFTTAVIDGLRGAASNNTDGLITVRELADYVDRRVVDWIRRHRPRDLRVSSGITIQLEGRMLDLPLAVAPAGVSVVPEYEFEVAAGDSVYDPAVPDPPPIVPMAQDDRAGERRTEANGMDFRYAPPGRFQMGSPAYERGRDSDEKQHRVEVTRGFWISETEVTQGQWRQIMGYNPAYFSACGDECPVERVSWYDAVAFANRLSEAEGLPACYLLEGCYGVPGDGCRVGDEFCEGIYSCEAVRSKGGDCRGYRLPTEAEWEYAARAGSMTPFWTGEKLTTQQANFDGNYLYDGMAGGKYRREPLPVGSLGANPWGIYDVHGNLWEWTEDSIEWHPGRDSRGFDFIVSVFDPDSLNGIAKAIRGGGWISSAAACRSANRDRRAPSYRSSNLGFRLTRTAKDHMATK